MGCIASKEIDDNYPNVFKVINVDDYGNQLGSGLLEIKNFEIVLYQKGRSPIMWPLKTLRRYGFDADHFSFESGRRCRTGPGIYAFRCQRAEQLFNLIQSRIQGGESNGVSSSGRDMNLRNSFSVEDSLISGGSSSRRTAPNRATSQGGTGRLSSSGSLGAISPMSTTSAPIIRDTTLPSLNLPDVPEDSPPTQSYENEQIITASIIQNFQEINYYERQRPPFLPLGNHTYANSCLASTDKFKFENVKKSNEKINDVKTVLEEEAPPSPKVENAREYMNILPATQPIHSGTQAIFPGTQPTLPATQPILSGTQAILTGTQSILPGTQPTLPATQPILSGTQAILTGTQSILPGTQPTLPATQPILSGTQAILPGTEPIHTGTEPILPGTQPILPGTQAIPPGTHLILSGTQYIFSGTLPILSGARPIFSGTRPMFWGTQAKPSGTQPKPSGAQPKPSGAQAKPSGTQPEPSGAQAKPSGTQPEPSGAQAKHSGTQPKPSGAQAKLSKTQPKLSKTQSKLSKTQPKLSKTQPKLSKTQPKLSKTQPMLSGTQPILSETQPKIPRVIDKVEPPASPEPEEIELVERRIDLYDAPDTFNKYARGSLHRIAEEPILRAPPRPESLHRISEEPSLPASPRPSKSLNYIVLDLERTGGLPRSPTSPNASENGQQPSGGYTSIDFQKTVALSNSIHPDSDLDRDSCRKTRHSSNAFCPPETNGSCVGD